MLTITLPSFTSLSQIHIFAYEAKLKVHCRIMKSTGNLQWGLLDAITMMGLQLNHPVTADSSEDSDSSTYQIHLPICNYASQHLYCTFTNRSKYTSRLKTLSDEVSNKHE